MTLPAEMLDTARKVGSTPSITQGWRPSSATIQPHSTASQGKGILMVSSELPEILGMSDRVLVMHEGRISGEFTRAEATQDNIMKAATGERAA